MESGGGAEKKFDADGRRVRRMAKEEWPAAQQQSRTKALQRMALKLDSDVNEGDAKYYTYSIVTELTRRPVP